MINCSGSFPLVDSEQEASTQDEPESSSQLQRSTVLNDIANAAQEYRLCLQLYAHVVKLNEREGYD